jgi:branched-chain amino acid transport system ATP-binding protein
MPLLEVSNIDTYYGDSQVLRGASLQAESGQCVAVLGRNGSGKTTLLRSVMGFNRPRRGRITFKSTDVTNSRPYEIARLGVGLIPQGRRVFGSLSVEETLRIALRKRGAVPWSVEDVLRFFPRLKDRFGSRAKTLSGGEQQMLACGRALVGNPDLILMDEPSEGLSPLLLKELVGLIGELKIRGASIVLVEQNCVFALALADHVYIMSRGRIVHEAEPDELKRDEQVRSRYLGV